MSTSTPVRSAAFARGGIIMVIPAPTASAPNCLRETSPVRWAKPVKSSLSHMLWLPTVQMGTSEFARPTCCAHRRANRKLTAWRGMKPTTTRQACSGTRPDGSTDPGLTGSRTDNRQHGRDHRRVGAAFRMTPARGAHPFLLTRLRGDIVNDVIQSTLVGTHSAGHMVQAQAMPGAPGDVVIGAGTVAAHPDSSDESMRGVI